VVATVRPHSLTVEFEICALMLGFFFYQLVSCSVTLPVRTSWFSVYFRCIDSAPP